MLEIASHFTAALTAGAHDRFRIVSANRTHLADLQLLIEQGFRSEGARWPADPAVQHAQPVRLDEVQALIDTPTNRMLVAIDRETAVGCVLITQLSDHVSGLGLLGVDAACRGRGLGTRLIAAAEAQAIGAFGSKRIELCVHANDTPLFNFYESRGFVRTGELRDYAYRNATAVFAMLAKKLAPDN